MTARRSRWLKLVAAAIPLTAVAVALTLVLVARSGSTRPVSADFPHTGLNLTISTEAEEGFDEERQWARDFWSALEPFHTTVYVNFLGDEPERVREAYGAEKYDRLRTLKRKYDPDNVFHLNQNIRPD